MRDMGLRMNDDSGREADERIRHEHRRMLELWANEVAKYSGSRSYSRVSRTRVCLTLHRFQRISGLISYTYLNVSILRGVHEVAQRVYTCASEVSAPMYYRQLEGMISFVENF